MKSTQVSRPWFIRGIKLLIYNWGTKHCFYSPSSHSHERKKFLPSASASGLPFGVENLSNGQSRGKKEQKSKRLNWFMQELGEKWGQRGKSFMGLVSGRTFFCCKMASEKQRIRLYISFYAGGLENRNQELKNSCFELWIRFSLLVFA